MRKGGSDALATTTLDDLLNDGRLTRLFSKDVRHCALQLWLLQIRSDQTIENRIVYGRLLPYSYSNNRWSSSEDDNFYSFGEAQAQVIRLNLYLTSDACTELLRQLSAGTSISAISDKLQLSLSNKLKERFGPTALAADELVYRPVAYLLNHDAYERDSPSSPHGGAGALSASIARTDKGALFRLGQDYDHTLTEFVVKHLNADTGLDFAGADTARFGDLELLVFPTLDDLERPLLTVNWTGGALALVARFDPTQLPHFSGFQFRLSIVNGDQITYSAIATAECGADGVFQCIFELSGQLRAYTDSTELEIFGFSGDHPREGTLCCRWRCWYVREFHLQGHMVGHGASLVKFDWLEKAARRSEAARVKAALTINRGNLGFSSRIGGRESDPWVPANRELASLFSRLHPPKSEGRFFLRWGQGDGEGRLQFVEWFRALLAKYQQHQVVIFDPYFEDAGLGLLSLCAAQKAEYIVFTSLSKSKQNEAAPGDKPVLGRINNLVASCDHNRHLLKNIRLRIFGLKEGRLHDRYILIMGADGLPVAGFNLSNSFQSAAENYPLLVTPIPPDVLLLVEQYMSGLVQEADGARADGEADNPSVRLLCDSTALPTVPRRYEPLRFLEKANAGEVLSVWTDEPSLQGLSGDSLKARMTALGMLKDDTLALPEGTGLRNCLAQQAGDFWNFTTTWDVLGEVLAHSRTGDQGSCGLDSEGGFLEFLTRFLDTSFDRAPEKANNELAVVDARLFRKPVEALLYSSNRPDHLFHATKYAALTWPEYFAIRFLWSHAPDALLATAEAQIVSVPVEPQGQDTMRLSLLSQIVSEISGSIQFNLSEVQRDCLIRSSHGLLQWMGLNAIERELEKPGGLATVLRLVAAFSHPEKIRALGWMVHRSARGPETVEIYNGLVAALRGELPATIPADDLRRLVDSMRGHMRQLPWAEPWLFRDVIFPLLRDDRANTDDACEIWVGELATLLGPEHQTRLFNRGREGQTTNIAACLFAHSSPERRQASLKLIWAILKRQQRIVQQPLASTSDWTRWDDALVASMWILTFTQWSQYYMRECAVTDHEVGELSRVARECAMVRPMNEWRSSGGSTQAELAAFLDQVEALLVSSGDEKSESQ